MLLGYAKVDVNSLNYGQYIHLHNYSKTSCSVTSKIYLELTFFIQILLD